MSEQPWAVVASLDEVEGDLTCDQCGEITRVAFMESDTWDEVYCGLCGKEYAVELRLVDAS